MAIPADSGPFTADTRVSLCQQQLSHAWMVRTFLKHCEESEDFPELMNMARAIFDLCRALDDERESPQNYLRILRKKLTRFRDAVTRFEQDAPIASTHINFQQAVVSLQAVRGTLELLAAAPEETRINPPAASDG